MKYFYSEIWRMDWGLGNPNKTATLIALLLIAIWALVFIWKHGIYLVTPLSTVLSMCLAHTFSRGGIVAWIIGSLPLIYYSRRPWKIRFAVAVILILLTFFISFFTLNVHERYVDAANGNDRSVNNRLLLWKAAPKMIVDSPGGWGIGEAGNAFMRWYQPLDNHERYRTLVNSHLTWLVEFRWVSRILYIIGWASIIALCLPPPLKPYFAIPLGVWLCFGTAACFSSVAECKLLWIIPLISLLFVVLTRLRTKCVPIKTMIFLSTLTILAFFTIVAILGQGEEHIKKTDKVVFLGGTKPELWVVIGEKKLLESRGTAKTIRAYLTRENDRFRSIAILESAGSLPADIRDCTVVIYDSEVNSLEEIYSRKQKPLGIILVDPKFSPWEYNELAAHSNRLTVIFGEFSPSPFLATWRGHRNLHVVSGASEYYPDFEQILQGDFLQK